uniref:Uncharacterized protein n=1 Tax=Sphaerodactylus townsendi TaxID=933632 RepID=A0ACB8FHF7_9SAUR
MHILLMRAMLVVCPRPPPPWKSPLQKLRLSARHPRLFGIILIISHPEVRTRGRDSVFLLIFGTYDWCDPSDWHGFTVCSTSFWNKLFSLSKNNCSTHSSMQFLWLIMTIDNINTATARATCEA